LDLGISLDVARPGIERFVTESVEQEVNCGRTIAHAELALEQGADLRSAKCARAVIRCWPGVNSAAELIELLIAEAALAAAAWSVI
jgi:hypothetical protein